MLSKSQPPWLYLPKYSQVGVSDVSSHNLRKTFNTQLLSRGAAVTAGQHLLGHASPLCQDN